MHRFVQLAQQIRIPTPSVTIILVISISSKCVSFFSTLGSTSCKICPSGSTSQSGSTVCCATGSVSVSGACTLCVAGFYAATDGINSFCSQCPSGKYSLRGASSCSPCPSGFSSSSGAGICCAAGNYVSTADRSTCVECPIGYYAAVGDSSCSSCPAGKYAASSGSTNCTNCSSRLSSTGGAGVCCPDGSYSLPSSLSCLQCSINSYSVGSADCSTCASGCPRSLFAQVVNVCVSFLGSYATSTGSTACTGHIVSACPAGSGMVSDQLGCYLCAINTFNTGSHHQCSSCPTGTVTITYNHN